MVLAFIYYFIVYNNNKYIIKDEKYEGLKLSPNGNYISYFVDNNGLKLKIFKIPRAENF